jgi:hypothetical protein
MTTLPIVERELRVAARRPATHWMRFLAVLTALGTWVLLLLSARNATAARLGHELFTALGVLALGGCLLVGVFLTADCLSEEKRAGTLGLLFLTDLKGYDVVLGKLAAASLHALYGLAAVLPVLGLTVLMGGVTGGEFGRLAAVLISTLFLSLSVGMFASAVLRETRQAMSAALFIMVGLTGLLPALWWMQRIFTTKPMAEWFCLWPSPAFAYRAAFDVVYGTSTGAAGFWASLSTILFVAAGALVAASAILPRIWQEKAAASPAKSQAERADARADAISWQTDSRRAALRANPFYWAARHDQPSRSALWLALGAVLLVWALALVGTFASSRAAQDIALTVWIFSAYGAHVVFKLFVAVEATRRLSEDRSSGVLELLLVTPLPERAIWQGQARALRDRFHWPKLLLALMNLGMVLAINAPHLPGLGSKTETLLSWMLLGGIALLYLDADVMGWVGMWTALRAKRPYRAVLGTVGRVLFPPWLAVFLFVFWEEVGRGPDPDTAIVLWFLLSFATAVMAGVWAKRDLHAHFRRRAAGEPLPKAEWLTTLEPRMGTAGFKPSAIHPTHP